MYPENFRYTKEHEWVRVEGDTGTVGITDHAQKELGDIVYVDLCPRVGANARAGQDHRLGRIGEGRIGHLFAGLRRSRRDQRRAGHAPEKLNEDPHGDAWLVKIQLERAGGVGESAVRRRLSKVRRGDRE